MTMPQQVTEISHQVLEQLRRGQLRFDQLSS